MFFPILAARHAALALAIMACTSCGDINKNHDDHDHYVEVGAKTLSKIQKLPEATSSRSWQRPHVKSATGASHKNQWFGADLGAASDKHTVHAKQHQHQLDGFVLDQVGASHERHTPRKTRSVPNAGMPILQALRMKPSVRETLGKQDPGVPDPGDDYTKPSDVVVVPGDALLQLNVIEQKPSSMMRRERLQNRDFVKDVIDAKKQQTDSDCDKCMDCHGAEPNEASHGNHSAGSGGIWCMCLAWADWQTALDANQTASGVYPGPSSACTMGCLPQTNETLLAGVDCASLNCSCDLNVYWNMSSAAPEA